MAARKKGLGRGLDALLGSTGPGAAQANNPATATDPLISADPSREGVLRELPIDQIQAGKYQPRRDMRPEALQELAASIQAQGVMQPIVVRPIAGEQFEIIAGERRWRASQQAGLERIPALVKDVPDEAAIAMALIENIQREDLNPIEEALALQRLQEEFDLTHQEIADAVGKSRAGVSNLLRLLQLESEVRVMLEHGDLEAGHAKALLALSGGAQLELARRVVNQGLSVRQTENAVRQSQKPKKPQPGGVKSRDTARLEEELGEKLGLPVAIKHKSSGSGTISFSYSSVDELDGLLERLQH